MKISFEVNEINYSSLAELLIPVVHDKLTEKDGVGMAILSKITGMPPSIASNIIDMLPQKTKDEIAVMLIDKNKENIIKLIIEYANKKGLSFKIDNFKVE